MSSSKVSSKRKPLNIVDSLRKKAAKLKDGKSETADAAVGGLFSIRKVLEQQLDSAKKKVVMMEAGMAMLSEVASSKPLTGMLKTLVGNVVQDCANRINEAANMVEALQKNEVIAAKLDEVKRVSESISAKGYPKSTRKKTARSSLLNRFRVVKGGK